MLLNGIELGRPIDLLVAEDEPRALGFDVLCRDQSHRFLPFAAAAVKEDAIEIESPLVLLDDGHVAFYRKQATALSDLNGGSAEVVVARDGSIEGVTSR